MAQFQYQGVDKSGKTVSGMLDAPAEGELRMMLRSQGVRPTRINKAGALNADLGQFFSGGARLNNEQLLGFTRQLQVLINSGVPIVQSLDILADQAGDKNSKAIIGAIREKVSGGTYFWEAVAAYPKSFSKIYIALLRAGEASGAMDAVLKRLTRYMEDAERLRKLVRSAMIYPASVIVIGVGVVSLMLIFVIPKFEELLKGNGQVLPAPTQFVIDASHFMVNNIYLIIGSIGAIGYLSWRYVKTPSGKAVVDRLMFKLPILGEIAQKSGVAKFTRTLQTLLAAGVNLIDAIDICKTTIGNAVLEDAVGKIRSEIEAGNSLGVTVNRISVFPRMAKQMIAVGESTGALDKMLEKVAEFYEEEVESMVQGLTKLIEPVILVVLGGAVGGMMISMYLPIFKMAGGVE